MMKKSPLKSQKCTWISMCMKMKSIFFPQWICRLYFSWYRHYKQHTNTRTALWWNSVRPVQFLNFKLVIHILSYLQICFWLFIASTSFLSRMYELKYRINISFHSWMEKWHRSIVSVCVCVFWVRWNMFIFVCAWMCNVIASRPNHLQLK